MDLSTRLEAICKLAECGESLCDVGCDHGYVCINMVTSGKYKHAIAMDIGEGPLSMANANIISAGLKSKIKTRQSDGLKNIEADEADCVIIAGMGGPLVIKILEDSIDKAKNIGRLILQPQSEIPKVREYIRTHGFVIEDEDMVLDDGKFYPMFRVRYTGEATQPNQDDELYDTYGRHLLIKKSQVLKEYLDKENESYQKIKADIEDRLSDVSDGKKEKLLSRILKINKVLSLNERAQKYYTEV